MKEPKKGLDAYQKCGQTPMRIKVSQTAQSYAEMRADAIAKSRGHTERTEQRAESHACMNFPES